MKKNGKILGDLISTVTIAVLFLVILMLVVFSAVSYQRSVEKQDANNNTRAVLSYVITAVKASESGRVTVEDQDGIRVLTIEDPSTGYGQQIFHKDGKVQETYGRLGTSLRTDDALVIGEAGRFEMSWLQDNLLEIRTEAGTSCVHVRPS